MVAALKMTTGASKRRSSGTIWGSTPAADQPGMLAHDMESGEKYWLDLEKFLKGFQLWIENGGDQYGAVQGHEVDCCNIDAGCADDIIQYALCLGR